MKHFLSQLKSKILPEPIFRQPRIWSNRELEKIGHLFTGHIVNVSAWEDCDKEGRKYRDYFTNAKTYETTNFFGTHGVDTLDNILDLEKDLPKEMINKWDTVFNHTTLEHIYDYKKAFDNLCKMSNDIVILVVPWYQQYHATNSYGDYWRFSEESLRRMFDENHFTTLYSSTGGSDVSKYVFIVAKKYKKSPYLKMFKK